MIRATFDFFEREWAASSSHVHDFRQMFNSILILALGTFRCIALLSKHASREKGVESHSNDGIKWDSSHCYLPEVVEVAEGWLSSQIQREEVVEREQDEEVLRERAGTWLVLCRCLILTQLGWLLVVAGIPLSVVASADWVFFLISQGRKSNRKIQATSSVISQYLLFSYQSVISPFSMSFKA